MAARKVPMTEKTLMSLIYEVKARACIWDPDDEHYNDRYKLAKQWESISRTLGIPEDCIRAKWKNLRDLFKREEKKCITKKEYTSRWRHYTHLMFMKKNGVETQTLSDASSTDDDTALANYDSLRHLVKEEKQEDNSYQVLITRDGIDKNRLSEPEAVKPAKKLKLNDDDNDYDTMFLQSLTPFFRDLEPWRKLTVRNKIQDILRTELAAQNNFVLPH